MHATETDTITVILDFAPIVFLFALIAVTLVIIAKMFPTMTERVSAFMDRLDGVDEEYTEKYQSHLYPRTAFHRPENPTVDRYI